MLNKVLKLVSCGLLTFAIMSSSALAQDRNENGWTNVSLVDKSPFDINCEYRIKTKYGTVNRKGGKTNITYYAAVVYPEKLILSYDSSDPDTSPRNLVERLVYSEKKWDITPYYNSDKVEKMENRCNVCRVPAGAIVLFNQKMCPRGWERFPGHLEYHPQADSFDLSLCVKSKNKQLNQ